ncbi:bifunctional precorrin-2 dehydrogenase/sirohydrochlorin ferrochelatase [Halorubrum sp. Atlit-8R]|uniref:precorrin-2 dehydrogenase/sirohydrochlorin ferrochelatase family protein n=1 Tax=unclassified Halorubrum TaxID=2642239 RepID=UPI000EF20717|nr:MULTISPECIES: bifunctional precorrin-2 dehydrogenase/sirohydrochlorin ferrochelatase [unclassified Halorubrum]RLM70790.1 bifunctional precorrin-2 dehydrogenase/sirohydrochlorin ferrochelatase [Halorubrum sp. Atlit-9R]RLM71658.1 bifunctional precorrin-2 dehydrogenase/sirohydrochlorin ferrochelatase [Halorubrum sp. Atlit-9R]RLM83057.1 bifunctional precorrin-2 dehydrogenase/sirohydrochlorin ferrochelatase [Halorubrum sp. Atlit-8R]
MTPLYHDLAGETVAVFGGGAVGARKARGFDEVARVVVVSPEFDERLLSLADERPDEPSVELIRAAPDPEAVPDWIDRLDPALAVAATDDAAVNAAVESAALDRGILVNRTDVSGGRDPGSVVVPATVEDDPVTVALSTGGTSPALAKALRERIEAEIEGAGAMAALSGEIREELKAAGVPPAKRREAVRRVVRSRGVWKGLQKGRSNGRQEADTVIEEVLDR